MAKFKETELLDYKKNIKENRYWMSNFTKSFTNETNPDEILNVEAKINSITAKQIQDVAKKYLTKDKVIGILMPKKIKYIYFGCN